jgi:enoyl-CoA hydratase
MSYETIRYEPGAVARIRLDRADKLNAQSWLLLNELDDALTRAANDGDIRVIILSGEGRAFSAGHDLDSPQQIESQRARTQGLSAFDRTGLFMDVYTDSHLRWRNIPKPTIAMVHGYCIYGGWMIASAMDFIFAADDALLIPTYGDYFTTHWDIGARKAKEILYENRFMTAEEALTWGFVNRVYPREDLERETLSYAERVCKQSPFTNRTVKFAINQSLDNMGFSTSVRAVGESFIRSSGAIPGPQQSDTDAARAAETTPAARPSSGQGRFRNLISVAMEHLRQDQQKREPPSGS